MCVMCVCYMNLRYVVFVTFNWMYNLRYRLRLLLMDRWSAVTGTRMILSCSSLHVHPHDWGVHTLSILGQRESHLTPLTRYAELTPLKHTPKNTHLKHLSLHSDTWTTHQTVIYLCMRRVFCVLLCSWVHRDRTRLRRKLSGRFAWSLWTVTTLRHQWRETHLVTITTTRVTPGNSQSAAWWEEWDVNEQTCVIVWGTVFIGVIYSSFSKNYTFGDEFIFKKFSSVCVKWLKTVNVNNVFILYKILH